MDAAVISQIEKIEERMMKTASCRNDQLDDRDVKKLYFDTFYKVVWETWSNNFIRSGVRKRHQRLVPFLNCCTPYSSPTFTHEFHTFLRFPHRGTKPNSPPHSACLFSCNWMSLVHRGRCQVDLMRKGLRWELPFDTFSWRRIQLIHTWV